MAFSADAIGFYLQLEDQLTPSLNEAGTAYTKFVKMLESANVKAFKSAQKGMSALASLVDSFSDLPKTAAAAYDTAITQIQKKAKPIKQAVEIEFTAKSKSKFVSNITNAVSKALAGAKIKLSPMVPMTRSKAFDTSVSLRKAYKSQIQPPDFIGGFENIPKFNEGGLVTGGKGGKIDDVLALLSKGEMVLPADVSKLLQSMTDRARNDKGQFVTEMPAQLKEALTTAESMNKVLEILHERVELGFDPKAPEQFAQAVKAAEKVQQQLRDGMKGLDSRSIDKIAPKVKDINNQFKAMREHLPKLEGPLERLLGKILGQTRLIALRNSLKDITEHFDGLKGGVQDVTSELGVTQSIDSAYENFQQINQVLGLSRGELADYRSEVTAYLNTIPGLTSSTAQLTESLQALVHQNLDKEISMKLTPAVEGFAAATGQGRQEVAAMASTMVTQLNMSADQAENLLANIRAVQVASGVAPQIITDAFQESAQAMEPFLRAIGPDMAKQVLEDTTRMTAAIESQAPGLGKAFAEIFGQAVQGNEQSLDQIAMLTGKGFGDVQDMVQNGDIAGLLDSMSAKFARFADNPDALRMLTAIGESAGVSTEQLQKLTTIGPEIAGAFANVTKAGVSAGQSVEFLNAQASGNVTWFQEAANSVDRWIQGFPAARGVIDFFKEFNPVVLVAVGQLAGMAWTTVSTLVPAVVSAMGKLYAWAASYFAVAAATTTATTAQAAAATTTAATSTAAAGGLASIAAGLTALTPAIPVLLVLAGAAVAVGAALWLASPALDAVLKGVVGIATVAGNILIPVLTGVVDLVKTGIVGSIQMATALLGADPGRVAALAGSLIAFGGGMIAFGVGLAGFGTSALVAVPGLLALSKVMKTFGPANGGGIGAMVTSLVESFKVDDAALNTVLNSLKSAVAFMREFGNLAVIVAGLSVGATMAEAVDKVLSFFGAGSPMENLSKQGGAVARTIWDLMQSFSMLIKTKTFEVADQIAAAVGKSAVFVSQLGVLIESMRDLGVRAGNLDDGMFTSGPLSKLAENRGKIFESVKAVMQDAAQLTQINTAPLVTPQQIDSVTKPSTVIVENRDVVDKQEETNSLLRQLVTIMASQQGTAPAPVNAPRGRPQSGLGRDMAEGRY